MEESREETKAAGPKVTLTDANSLRLMHSLPHLYEYKMTRMVEYISIDEPGEKELRVLMSEIWNKQGKKGECDISCLVFFMTKERYHLIKFVIEQALRAVDLFPSGRVQLLPADQAGSLTLSPDQALVLVSLMFLGLIPADQL